MQHHAACFAQKRECPRADQRRQNRRGADASISDRSRILHSRRKPALGFFGPLLKDWLKAIWFANNLRRLHMGRGQFILRKITSSRPKIRTGIAQNVDQLKSHSVALPEIKHLGFAQLRELRKMPKTKPRPEFSHTTRDQKRVLIEIGRCRERTNVGGVIEVFYVERLAPRDFLKHRTNIVAVGHAQLLQPFQTTRQRFNKRSLILTFLQRRKRRDKIDNRADGSRARWMSDPNG